MAEKSTFFNSVNGDRQQGAEAWAAYFASFIGNGVFASPATTLQVVENSGMALKLKAGLAFINGYRYENDGELAITIPTADGVLGRIDRVVIRWNLSNREIKAAVKQGTPAATPAAPTLQRDADIYEIAVADVTVTAGATAITQSKITDKRSDAAVCGWVSGVVTQIDATTLFSQYQSSFDEWFNDVQNTLSGDTAGNLLNLINSNAFATYTHSKSGTVHELTLAGGGANIKFKAAADFAEDDTFTVNGTAVTAKMPDGSDLCDDFFKTDSVCMCFLDNSVLYFIGGGAMSAQLVITLTASNGASLVGQTVTVTAADSNTELSSFDYDGQPETLSVPIGTNYKITVADKAEFKTPAAVAGTIAANTVNAVTITYQHGIRYGFKRQKSDSSPTARITYIHDAVGKSPAAMNLTSGAFDAGSWQSFIDEVSRPVMLKTDGTVDYELCHTDQTKKIDGSTASDISNASYGGNAMVEFTDAFKWVHRSQDATYEYVIFSNIQYDNTYHAYAHTNAAGIVQDAFYWGMFKGSNSSSRLRSLADKTVMVSQTRNTEVSYATAQGSGYYTIYKSGWDYIGDLLTLISKSDDSQTAFGAGCSSANNSAAIATGTLKDKGAFWGSADATSDVKVFYIEGFWGNVWEGMAGLVYNGQIKSKMTPNYNFDGTGYTATGITPSGTSGGFISSASVTDESGFIPKIASGAGDLYYCDGFWFNTSQVDYALVGGNWDDALRCGSRCVSLGNLASDTNADIGSRLSYLSPSAA